MTRILILYATKQGQTRKIAEGLASELRHSGHIPCLYDLKNPPPEEELKNAQAIVLGAPVHAGGYPKEALRWAQKHNEILNRRPSAFFSVCLGIMQQDPLVQQEEKEIARKFFKESGWHPELWDIFAGAVPYSRYNWLLKWIMRRIVRKAGGDALDWHKDYEYTDWEQVRKFAGQLSSAQTPS